MSNYQMRPASGCVTKFRRFKKFRFLTMASLLALGACSEGGEEIDFEIIREIIGQPSEEEPSPPPPPPPPPEPDPEPAPVSTNQPTALEASRFLVQSTFGPSMNDIEDLQQTTLSQWIVDQIAEEPTLHLGPLASRVEQGERLPERTPTDSFYTAAVSAPDQLRQRMAYALSQILVVSYAPGSGLEERSLTLAYYMDVLARNALGNYRDLLEEVTYSPAMSVYLTYYRNRKANPETGSSPDENYAREIMQLFTIGLVQLQQNGEPQPGEPETYNNDDVVGLAKVFTGLAIPAGFNTYRTDKDGMEPLIAYPEHHSMEEKTFLGETIPAGTGPEESIDRALDILFEHPNVAPFVSRQLIQRFVTSDPTPAYVQRVADAFDAGSYRLPDGQVVGDGRRGDLSATIAAILLDTEARQAPETVASSFGKVREPILRFTHWARAFDIRSPQASEEHPLNNTNAALGQHPFYALSVFNFYRPGYVANGSETGEANLTAPELQIVNESSVARYANFMSRYVRDETANVSGSSGDAFSPDYSDEFALVEDPEGMVDRLDLLLTYGTMSDVTKQRIIDVMNSVPIRTDANEQGDRRRRLHYAIQMGVTSPGFIVQR